jgi:hypothetical protein
MHHNLDIFKDPVFWGILLGGALPLAILGATLIWLK